ncbi:MAG: homoserine kinase [Clostridium perfringens]|nr:homoserine kinase [Clostridium perfringens]
MVKVKVPCSSANLGPGFDCIGIGLNLYNTFDISEISSGLLIEGCPKEYQNVNNIIYKAMEIVFKEVSYNPSGIKISIESDIPISRGLGSSSSCIIGGMMAANYLSGNKLSRETIANLATKMEGHPDNVVPCLFGGLIVSLFNGKETYYEKIKFNSKIKFFAMFPNFNLQTKKARDILPKELDFKFAMSNIAASSFLVASIANNNFKNIKHSMSNVIHENFRETLIPNFFDIKEKALSLNALGVYLSGAGPTIMAIASEDNIKFKEDIIEFLRKLDNKWLIKELSICNNGTTIYK